MSVEPVEWKNYPSTETPLAAETLNQQQAYVRSQAEAAAQSAAAAAQSAAEAGAQDDEAIHNVIATPGSQTRSLTDALYGGATATPITQYGAAVDGTTDDTAAIQATIDAVATAGGGVVLFPPGDTLITEPLTLDGQANVLLAGIHWEASRVLCDDTGFLVAGNNSDAGGVVDLSILQLASTNTHNAIEVHRPRRYRIENCTINGFGGDSIAFYHPINCDIIRNRIWAWDSSRTNGNAGIALYRPLEGTGVPTTVNHHNNYVQGGLNYGYYCQRGMWNLWNGDIAENCRVGFHLQENGNAVMVMPYAEANTEEDFVFVQSGVTLIHPRYGIDPKIDNGTVTRPLTLGRGVAAIATSGTYALYDGGLHITNGGTGRTLRSLMFGAGHSTLDLLDADGSTVLSRLRFDTGGLRVPDGGLTVDGALQVTGTKNARIPDPDDPTRAYQFAAAEADEPGVLMKRVRVTVGETGTARVPLPAHFTRIGRDPIAFATATGGPVETAPSAHVEGWEDGAPELVVNGAPGEYAALVTFVRSDRGADGWAHEVEVG